MGWFPLAAPFRRGGVRLVSRNGNTFKSFSGLCEGLARDLNGRPCVLDRKSTRLNSSHLVISYAVFCLKKKKKLCLKHSRCRITPELYRLIRKGVIQGQVHGYSTFHQLRARFLAALLCVPVLHVAARIR